MKRTFNHNYIITTKPCKMCSFPEKHQSLAELTANQPYGQVAQGLSQPSALAVPQLQAVLSSEAVSHLPCARGGQSRLPTAAAAGSRNGWGWAASPRRTCTAAGNPAAKSNLWVSQPPAPKQDTHYATFKMAYLSAKKALMTFRITTHFAGFCFSH